MRRLIAAYENGNYRVKLFSDGTKVRSTEDDEFICEFPDSIDLKITDYCDLACPMCHERSSTLGREGELSVMFDLCQVSLDEEHDIEYMGYGKRTHLSQEVAAGAEPVAQCREEEGCAYLPRCKSYRSDEQEAYRENKFVRDADRQVE